MPQRRISRTDARAQGLSRYFTGKPCKRGRIAERYANQSETCVECAKIAGAKCLAKPETIVKRKAYGVAYRAKPGVKAQRKDYRLDFSIRKPPEENETKCNVVS